jgi:outer membrane cobalamin receptor
LEQTKARIESALEVQAYLQDLKYALEHGATVTFQMERRVDQNRDVRYTNKFTIADLFPDKDPVVALKRELQKLTIEEYIQTVKDLRFPKRSEMREFGKVYNGKDDVYIKIRVELLSQYGNHTTFVMSFHYAEIPFTPEMFPYRKR